MRRLEPGEVAALALVGSALAIDVALIRSDRCTISTCMRRGFIPRIVIVALAAHLLVALPFDPLTWLGSKVTRR